MNPRPDARTRILLHFLLGIALPSGLLGYLAFRGIQNDRALAEREQRLELEEAAARVDSAAESLLRAAGLAVGTATEAELPTLVRTLPTVEAVFTLVPEDGVRVVAADGLLFEAGGRGDPGSGDASDPLLQSAYDRELRRGDLQSALRTYERAVREATDPHVQALALAGQARVNRKLGRWNAAIDGYERLRSDFGDLPSRSGMPPGPAASLELATVLLQAGDTVRAVSVLSELYADLVDARWRLTPARFDLMVEASSDLVDALVRAGVDAVDRSRILALEARGAEQRSRARSYLAFEAEARDLLGDVGSGEQRVAVDVGSRYVLAVLPAAPSDVTDTVRRGFVVSPGALTRVALEPEAGRLAWKLRTADGTEVAASVDRSAEGAPSTAANLAGFTPWTLELSPSASGRDGGFLTSRRAIYLYAFVLLAGILLFGLTLSIRNVGRELELARMKSDFVSTVSHELKSPLTAIRQLAELLQAGRVPTTERVQQYYDVLLEQSERLSRLVDNVLDFERMEAGSNELSREFVDLAGLVEDTVSEAHHRVAHDGFTIRTSLDHPLPRAHVDPDAVRQALGNLIDNAVKYSGTSREVEVRGRREDGSVVLAVRDFGIGMTPQEVDRVFERFYRGGDELTRSVKGTGLGLTLVKQIVDAHGGRVDVVSTPGQGSTFSIRLPLDGHPGGDRVGSP